MSRISLLLAVFLFTASLFSSAAAMADSNVLFIVDYSGSMKKVVEGKQTRIEAAKKVLGETLGSMPADARLGLMAYGHRKAKDCTDIELIAPIGGEDAASISKTIKGLQPKGETPIADALRRAGKSFNAFKGQQNSIILVTDGVEECKGDPCAAAQELKDAGLDVHVNIVGFTLSAKEGQALQCVADITGGKYYSASNTAGLTDALKQAQQQVQQPQEVAVVQTAKKPEHDDDIISTKNGGTLVMAPNDAWKDINSAGTFGGGATYEGEGIWSFKDGKPATFDRVEVQVGGANQYNLKDFDVLVGDDLNGTFASQGSFTAMNAKVMPDGWQAFKFGPATAKYIKIVFKTDQGGGYVRGHRIKVIGKVDDTGTAVTTPSLGGTDVLAAKNGGTLVMAPNDAWKNINTTGDFGSGATYAGDGIWSFKDGKAATFDRIEVQVGGANQYDLKDFEVQAGDDLNGTFTSAGTFTVQNTKVMPDGWQKFSFPAVTAKFVKISFKSDQGGGYVRGHAIRLFGKLDDSAAAAAKAPEETGTDLLAEKNGGSLLVSPNDEWKKLNNGKTDRATTYSGAGIWSFKGEKPATIDAVEVLVPEASQYNLKDFEVSVGDEGPTGKFTSVGTFTVKNMKVMPEGWQRFSFTPVTGKYIKVEFKSDQGGGYVAANQLHVLGKVQD